jgi:hypothetical protein
VIETGIQVCTTVWASSFCYRLGLRAREDYPDAPAPLRAVLYEWLSGGCWGLGLWRLAAHLARRCEACRYKRMTRGNQ